MIPRPRLQPAGPAQPFHEAAQTPPGRLGRPALFGVGVALIATGVTLHLTDFVQMRQAMGSMPMPALDPASMAMSPLATWGMAIDLTGLALATLGLLPRGWLRDLRRRGPAPAVADPIEVHEPGTGLQQMDSAAMTGAHWFIMLRLFLGLILDTMKPATLAFVLPGLRAEYGLTAAQASLLPLFALTGTTVGSIVFGYLGDVLGRRLSFILTALFLAATAICGLMPAFVWQLVMCFTMGMAAGGELPLVYSMLAETMPARHRGWLSVVVGGIGGLGGLLAASMVATLLEPSLSWRGLFLPNLPTALVMLGLIWWVPESPRFLLLRGFHREARAAMAQIGVRVASATSLAKGAVARAPERRSLREAFRGELRGRTVALCFYGGAWGLANWGFITWLPTMLRDVSGDAAVVSRLLATSALFAIPGTLVTAALFALWSSKGTAVLSALATGGVLLLFAVGQQALAADPALLAAALALLLVASSSMIGVLAPYSVEVYPTDLRSAGSGVVSASSKATGTVAPGLIGAVLGVSSGLALPALVVGLPIVAAGFLMARTSPETRGRSLEELTAAPVPVLAH